jgi:hypothetical protein
MRLICRVVGHRRSIRQARRASGGWVSRCKLCGEPLIRRGPKAWHSAALATSTDVPEAPLPLFERESC